MLFCSNHSDVSLEVMVSWQLHSNIPNIKWLSLALSWPPTSYDYTCGFQHSRLQYCGLQDR